MILFGECLVRVKHIYILTRLVWCEKYEEKKSYLEGNKNGRIETHATKLEMKYHRTLLTLNSAPPQAVQSDILN